MPQLMDKKAETLSNYFTAHYGAKRAIEIAKNFGPAYKLLDTDKLIELGNKWHYVNLFLQSRINSRQFTKAMQDLGYELIYD